MAILSKKEAIQRAHKRLRKKVKGTETRPRLATHRTSKHIYVQIIDDSKGITLVSASSVDADFKEYAEKETIKNGGNLQAAKIVGKLIGEKAQKINIKQVVFDRGGYLYHGRIQVLADAARESGLEF